MVYINLKFIAEIVNIGQALWPQCKYKLLCLHVVFTKFVVKTSLNSTRTIWLPLSSVQVLLLILFVYILVYVFECSDQPLTITYLN